MTSLEQLWIHYKENTEQNTDDNEGLYDLQNHAEEWLGGVSLDLRNLDRHCGYDFESVYGKPFVALFDIGSVLKECFHRAITEKKLISFLDLHLPEWREDWEIPNHDADRYLGEVDLLEELEFADKVDSFMGAFGFVRFSTSDLWEDPSFVMPVYEDPNQLKLPFGE